MEVQQRNKRRERIGLNELQRRITMLKWHLEFSPENAETYYKELKMILLRGQHQCKNRRKCAYCFRMAHPHAA